MPRLDLAARIDAIKKLCSFERRLAGTDAERRAANWAAQRLREIRGRRVVVEPIYVQPRYAAVHAVHCMLAFVGSLVAVSIPPLGFGLVLVAATSMYLDLNYRFYLVRRLFFRRASQNVISRGGRSDARARLIVSAHLDTARTGLIFREWIARGSARQAQRSRIPLGPFRFLFWSMAVLLPLLGARLAGIDSNLVSALQVIPTLFLLIGAFSLAEIELSPVVPGANDNASGVATVLALAEDLEREAPEHLDVWFVFTGAEKCLQEGMRSFVRAHREQLDPADTYVICVDTVGRGNVRYETSAGWVVSYEMSRRLAQLCDAIAEADSEEEDRYGALPLRHGLAGDAMPARLRGIESTTIACLDEDGYVPDYHLPTDTPDRIDPEALERAHDFTLELIRQLDRDVGRRADD
jgi:hypothetical protein